MTVQNRQKITIMNNNKDALQKMLSSLRSFTYALQGIRHAICYETNMRIHVLATIVVIAAGCVKHLSQWQWVAIISSIGLVWVAELFNTCIERLCDLYVGDTYNPNVKIIKDVAAGAVLVAAIVSIVLALIIFTS